MRTSDWHAGSNDQVRKINEGRTVKAQVVTVATFVVGVEMVAASSEYLLCLTGKFTQKSPGIADLEALPMTV